MRADLHIHTVLSPCGDLEMTPVNIVKQAKEKGLDIIGVTDHNSTLMAPVIREVARREGINILCGAEITTREEVHVLAFVDGDDKLKLLQDFLFRKLIKVPNNPDVFGYQPVINEHEEVLYMVDDLLINAIECSVDEVSDFVYSLGGIFVPAHIDKRSNSLISQLGFVPPYLKADAVELSCKCDATRFFDDNESFLKGRSFITSSDAHYVADVGCCYTELEMDSFSFSAVKNALSLSGIDNFVK